MYRQRESVVEMRMSVMVILLVLSVTGTVYSPAHADLQSTKSSIRESLAKGNSICTVVKDLIKAGTTTGEVVEGAIVLGHPVCIVVRCAVEAGGKLEEIVVAAHRAGGSSDVIVSCALDGGADPEGLALALEKNGLTVMGYAPPPGGYFYSPAYIPSPGGGGGGMGKPVSPSRP